MKRMTNLDSDLNVLGCTIGGVLALASKGGVVVFLARHHSEDRLNGDEGTAVEFLVNGPDPLVKDVTETIDPGDLRSQRDEKSWGRVEERKSRLE